MNQRKLNLVVILMSSALLGLVALQFYWINRALHLSEKHFQQSVQMALDNVIKRLEHRELLQITQQNMDNSIKVDSKLFTEFDSMGHLHWKEDKVITTRKILSNPDLAKEGVEIEVQEEAVISKTGFARRRDTGEEWVINLERPESEAEYEPMIDSLEYIQKRHNQRIAKMINQSTMVSAVLQHMANFDKPMDERISRELVDSLLNAEMIQRGINTPYEFGVVVWDLEKYKLIFADSVQNKASLIKNGERVALFPNDDFSLPAYLYVYFPYQFRYILKEMAAVLFSSMILILVVSGCFAFAVLTINRQKKLSEMKNDFINNMTHEFKTPVSTISLACEMLNDPSMRSHETLLARYLQIIKEENERLGEQIEKVLQIARLERNDFDIRVEETNLHELIEATLYNFVLPIEQREGSIRTAWNALQPIIQADKTHLSNIISNLIDNAIKYSPDILDIELTTENADKGIILTISDKGQGIPKDTISKIFDKFYRVPVAGDVHDVKGFGLGLSYVKTMIDAHYGVIRVNSEPHKGTTFIIFLPYRHERESR